MNLKLNLRYVAKRGGRCLSKVGEGTTKEKTETKENPEILDFRSVKETKTLTEC
jgi:hypothetical protein